MAALIIGLPECAIVDTDFCMRTILNFDDWLIRAAMARAAEDGESLTKLIERALRNYLETPCAPAQSYRAELLIKHGRPLEPAQIGAVIGCGGRPI